MRTKDRKSGMTMIEVMIATGILLMTMGGAFRGLMQARYLARLTAHRALAIQVARANIEALREAMGYNDEQLNPAYEHTTDMPAVISQIYSVNGAVVNVDFRPSYSVQEVTLGGGVSYKIVEFSVDWDEQTVSGTRNHFVELNTIISSSLNR